MDAKKRKAGTVLHGYSKRLNSQFENLKEMVACVDGALVWTQKLAQEAEEFSRFCEEYKQAHELYSELEG